MRIVVVGARGRLGGAMVEECRKRHEVVPFDHASLDVTDASAVQTAMKQVRPNAVINCTGYNAVDAAEEHPIEALAVNAVAVRTLRRVSSDCDAVFVHFSTDFVFDGMATTPMTETDGTNPRSVYAMSKLLGEWFALAAVHHFPFTGAPSYVLRVESLFGEVAGVTPTGSVASIVSALRTGKVPRVFEDRTVSPTYVFDAARATVALLEQRLAAGLYHCVNSGHGTWLDVATKVATFLGVPPVFETIRFADVTLRAARPQYCVLSNEKLVKSGIAMPMWQDALRSYLAPN